MIPLTSNAGSWNFLSFSFSALMIFWYVAGTAMLPSVPKIVSLLAKVTSGRLFLKSFSANSLVSLIIFWLFSDYFLIICDFCITWCLSRVFCTFPCVLAGPPAMFSLSKHLAGMVANNMPYCYSGGYTIYTVVSLRLDWVSSLTLFLERLVLISLLHFGDKSPDLHHRIPYLVLQGSVYSTTVSVETHPLYSLVFSWTRIVAWQICVTLQRESKFLLHAQNLATET